MNQRLQETLEINRKSIKEFWYILYKGDLIDMNFMGNGKSFYTSRARVISAFKNRYLYIYPTAQERERMFQELLDSGDLELKSILI